MRTTLLRWVLGASLLMAAAGCDKGEDHILEGRKAVKAGNFDQAITHFDNALKADPKSYHALWGKADAYSRNNDLPKQAELLEKIAADKDMMEKYASVVTPALETNYRKQAQALNDSDAAKETLLRKAIELNKKSEAHLTLAALLSKRGDDALKAQKWAEASAAFKAAGELRIARKERSKLQGKAEVADFKLFVQEYMVRFDPMKAELVTAGNYDEKTKTFFVEAEAEVEGKPGDEGYEQTAEHNGLVAVTEALNNLTWKLAGKERPAGATVGYSEAVVEVVEKGMTTKKPLTYRFRLSLPQDAVFEQVQKLDKGEFRKPGEVPPAAVESAAPGTAEGDEVEEPAAPGSDAPASAPAGDAPASAPASAAPATN